MKTEATYFYLNLFNEWPGFELPPPIVNVSDGMLILEHVEEQTFAPRACFRGGPFADFTEPGPWFRIRVFADPLPEGTYVQIYTATTAVEPFFDPDANQPFSDPRWQPAPLNELDILIPNTMAEPLWIGGLLRSDGRHTPMIHQVRVDFGRDSYLDFLPAIYSENEEQSQFLHPYLSLHESVLGSLEQIIADLPQLFDPYAVPHDESAPWLSWLTQWLAFDLSERWNEIQTRDAVAQAFQLYGLRGTVESLRQYLKLYAGVEARIEEPGLYANLWTLGENSTLGFTTMLAPAELQGAVLGTTATLDQSHLARGGRFGATLFDDQAHQFCVQVYCAELNRPGILEEVRTILEREKPAHTDYQLCVIDPRMRVGVQSRIGIDTIIAHGPSPVQLGRLFGTGMLSAETESCNSVSPTPAEGLPVCGNEVKQEEI